MSKLFFEGIINLDKLRKEKERVVEVCGMGLRAIQIIDEINPYDLMLDYRVRELKDINRNLNQIKNLVALELECGKEKEK